MGVCVSKNQYKLNNFLDHQGQTLRSRDSHNKCQNTELQLRDLIYEYFDLFDTNGDNELSLNEVLSFLKRIALKKQRGCITVEMAREFLDMVDKDGNGKVSKQEFFDYYNKV